MLRGLAATSGVDTVEKIGWSKPGRNFSYDVVATIVELDDCEFMAIARKENNIGDRM
jgi:hypothetical protein